MNPLEKSGIKRYSRIYFDAIEAVFCPQVQITVTDDGTVKIEAASNEKEEEYYEEVF